MKTSVKIAAAVAAALAGSAAFALGPIDDTLAAGSGGYQVKLNISGASAFETAFETELGNANSSICNNSPTVTYNRYLSSTADFRAYNCLLRPGVVSAGGGERALIYYRGELGSVMGVEPIARTATADRILRLVVNGTNCTTPGVGGTGTCTVTGYNSAADTATAGLTVDFPHVGISDLEPNQFVGENYPDAATIAKLQPALTSAQLQALTDSSETLVAQSFGVYVGTTADAQGDSLTNLNNLSKSVISAIFQGLYTDWNQVPKADGSNTTVIASPASLPIQLCRREAGSGTQVSASIFFNNKNCGPDYGFASTANPVFLNTVVENNSTGNMRTCVSTRAGAIGFISSEADVAGRRQIKIDNVGQIAGNNLGQAVAEGTYSFWFEPTWNTGATLAAAPANVQALANSLKTVAQAQASGPTAVSVSFLPAYNSPVFPAATPVGKQPISCFTRSKNSCAPAAWGC